MKTKLYFSYGMNTNVSSMAMRCPLAVSLGSVALPHYKFEFKSFATVTPQIAAETYGVLWEITENCEKSLDRLEGYPSYYNKIIVMVWYKGEYVPAMTYLMYPEEELNYPSDSYIRMLEEGYNEHGISPRQIDIAIDDLDDHFDLTQEPKDATLHSYTF
jgi:gamma-glutamylcyclotransferase (GGCT)/AIG2-like uncharacterized protein YtfP